MSDVRGLFKPGHGTFPRTNVAPERGPARAALMEAVKATAVKPLHANEVQHTRSLEEFLDTMTINERITIEIEMQSRNPTVHTFDYEPY